LKQIALRSIPDEIEAMVKKEAKAKGLSLNDKPQKVFFEGLKRKK